MLSKFPNKGEITMSKKIGSRNPEAVVSAENCHVPGTRKSDTSPAASGGKKTISKASRQETAVCPEELPRNQYGGTTCTERQPYLPWFVADANREKSGSTDCDLP